MWNHGKAIAVRRTEDGRLLQPDSMTRDMAFAGMATVLSGLLVLVVGAAMRLAAPTAGPGYEASFGPWRSPSSFRTGCP